MSAILESGLSPEQRAQADAADKAAGIPFTPLPGQLRAQQLINSAHNSTTQAAKLFKLSAVDMGLRLSRHLEEVVRNLCSELASFDAERDPGMAYAAVWCDALDAEVLVGYAYSRGQIGSMDPASPRFGPSCGDDAEVIQCWLNGTDILPVLASAVLADLKAKTLSAHQTHLKHEAERAQAMRDDGEGDWL